MDSPGDRLPSERSSPRRELQGPRPAPLKVSKDSHKIKKPPVAPPPARQSTEPAPQYRPPVIIYSVSPKVIHATPGEFMSLVQRLTGAGQSSFSSSAAGMISAAPTQDYVLPRHGDGTLGGVLSPAARLAAYEKAAAFSSDAGGRLNPRSSSNQDAFLSDQLEKYGGSASMFDDQPAPNIFPGILSPVPSSLPAISPNLFSPPANKNQIDFFHDLSPAMQRSRSFMDHNTFLASPSNILYTPVIPSPGAYWNLFNQYQDPQS